ncbi:histidine phosphatase family protein [Planctomonas psychrotolerans]|uniref:histidine phosphatase family protein n=1 Tax=Planctomonas psychrotolerans TaxID=2528712 RepID=UPI0012390333|nr:histidine phosphatase family protein [Planctomonas psychrotolerans]
MTPDSSSGSGSPSASDPDARPVPNAPTVLEREGNSSRIFLLRHGETEWSRSGQHTSVTDLPLTERGEQQARAVARVLGDHSFGLVLSSPRRRAMDTARLAGFGDRVAAEENLVEWDYGAYEGLTTREIVARVGKPWVLWRDGAEPGETPGETSEQVHRRMRAVLDRCEPVLDGGQDVLLVAHGHSLRALAAVWLGLPAAHGGIFSLATGTVSELGFEHGRPAIVRWNCPAGDDTGR